LKILLLLMSLPIASVAATNTTELARLARQLVGADQGVYVEAGDGRVLVAQAAARAVHPASVSKMPTTLALLRRLGADYRFVTEFSAAAPIRAGVLEGDLYVRSGSDPFLVDENALLIAQRLQSQGIRRVAGQLRVQGPLIFDWSDTDAASRLQQALGGQVAPAAREAVRSLPAASTGVVTTAAEMPGLQFAPGVAVSGNLPADLHPLLEHRSQPLLVMVKQLNDYSNNIFKPLADAAGGALAVQSVARSLLPEAMRTEVTLGDGAGTDARNRLSPRVAVKLLRALEQELQSHDRTLVDALPVSGIDEGTLKHRLDGAGQRGHVVGKTGTFGDYGASALVGAFKTAAFGTVYFAILNHGLPVPEARRRQDALVAALLKALPGETWPYTRDEQPAVARVELIGLAP
jgi:D-alanyl-D-alanine carboxypeptidase/D-alanyl-D-alanine-endopeptidase (penicillin-binding protein 4)